MRYVVPVPPRHATTLRYGARHTSIVDDLTAFSEYCEFGDDRVYLLLAIARTKENENEADLEAPTMRRVVEDPADLERLAAELDHAAGRYERQYRLYLTVNARDALAAFFALRERMDEWIRARLGGDEGVRRKFKRVDREFLSVLQSDGSRADKRLLFDLDDVGPEGAAEFRAELDGPTILLHRETPNGYHVVTEPFDYTEFESDTSYELKTDGLVFVSYIG